MWWVKYLNRRLIVILEHLIKVGGTSNIKEIAEHLGINERTVRYDIDKICEHLIEKNQEPLEKLSKGAVKITDIDSIKRILYEGDNLYSELSAEYKDALILIKIAYEEKININELSEQFNLSRSTIKTALKGIKDFLAVYDLELIIDYQKGLKLVGEEENLRRLQLKLLNQYVSTKDNSSFEKIFCSKEIRKYFENLHRETNSISLFINYIVKSLDRIISDEAYTTIKNYILIMLMRIRVGKQIESIDNERFFSETAEYDAVSKGISLLEANFNIHLSKCEIIKLTDYFLGSHNYSLDSSFYNEWVEIELLVKKIINNFDCEHGSDISKDRNLLDGLINHIKPAIYRINNRIELQNSILEEFLEYYPDIFQSGKKALISLEEFIGKEIPDEEIAFVSMHFKGALDRNISREVSAKNILLVCGYGYGTSKLLAQQIRESYNVNILDIIPLNQMEKYDLSGKLEKVDLIITTMEKENFKTTKPIVMIKNILKIDEIKALERYNLPKYNRKILFSNLMEKIERGAKIFDKQVIFSALSELMEGEIIDDTVKENPKLSNFLVSDSIALNIQCDSWQDGIRSAGKLLEDCGIAENSYTEAMIKSIEKNGPYMVIGDSLALPHAKNSGNVHKTGMSLITLKNEIEFPEGKKVSYVLAFSSADNKEHLAPLSLFLELVKNQDFLNFLQKSTSRKKITDYIKKYEFLVNLGKS